MKNKKAYLLSLDAFIALIIILGVVLFIKPTSVQVSHDMKLQEDLISVLSSIKIGEVNNSYVKQLISTGKITNFNQSVLEQIGEFYANSDPEAENLAQNILDSLDAKENIGLYFNNIPIAIFGTLNPSDSENMWTSRQIISGIQQGDSIKGYSSRAFLFSEKKVDYFYFGGYIGDGNITLKISGDITSIDIEAVFSGNFDLYINDVFAQTYSPSLNTPYKINLTNHMDKFSSGDNYMSFKSQNNLYIAGGYVKIVYNTSESLSSDIQKNFPGIDGLINVYDSFYIPGNLTNMEIFLHYNSGYNIFLTLGNKTIYEGNSSGSETSISLTNSDLSSILDYSYMNQKTIPLRLGLKNVSYLSIINKDADSFSVTDLSGSMAPGCSGASFWCCFVQGGCNTQAKCSSCGGTWEDKIGLAKQANNVFIDAVLNSSRNRVGLIGYSGTAPDSAYHQLSNNSVSLKNKVNSWTASGTTCICCGINKAVDKITLESSQEKVKSIVVMSDGEANVRCSRQGTGNAKQDAIQAACQAYSANMTVYAIGFGDDADEATLQSIASCGGGNYYYGDIDQLIDIYRQVASDIIEALYLEQTVVAGNVTTKLYPDSYISVDYDKTIPYGLIITAETEDFGNYISVGNFSVPVDTIPYEIKVVSYSGSKWTDRAEVYDNSSGTWESVFNLSEYGRNYVDLGDPYVVNIPIDKINYGENSIKVSTGLSPSNSSGGSPYDKIIFSLIKDISSYSSIVSSANGCTWTIEFEDGTTFVMNAPSNYSGGENCYYTSSNVAYNNNDAIDSAIFNLLSNLDLNSNNKIETKFSENDVSISSVEITGIPFTWETEVQVRVWR